MTANYSPSPREHPQPSRCQRQSLFRLGLLLVLIGILLASCSSAQQPDPFSVVQAAYDRLNEGDVDGFLEFFSDDAILIDTRHGRFEGTQAIRRYLEFNIIPFNLRFELGDPSTDGNVVTYTAKVYKDDYLIETLNNTLDVVVDGQIIFDSNEEVYLQQCERDPSQAFCS